MGKWCYIEDATGRLILKIYQPVAGTLQNLRDGGIHAWVVEESEHFAKIRANGRMPGF